MTKEEIKKLFEREGFPLDDEQARLFETYLNELLRWNRVHNLTALREPEQIVKRHFIESVSLTRCFNEAGLKPTEIADAGTGAGFPGVPLKIYLRTPELTLIESSTKKCAFLDYLKLKLGINYRVLCTRAEKVNERFETVVSRAMGEFDEIRPLLERLSRKAVFVAKGKELKPEWLKDYRPCKIELSFISFFVLWRFVN
ncbi:MAG: 16S rRNA (guanine(527)-N(7))-methyltransferase RsmG [Aquificae bacterium]|nr:16S rRNA (guanine(527)-N(7))-methyltransferase RsmG [Aquificota bacterium]